MGPLTAISEYLGRNRTESYKRIMAGLVLLATPIAFWAMYQETDPGIYGYKFTTLLYGLVAVWLVTSNLYRLTLVLGFNLKVFGAVGLVSFLLLSIS